MSSNITSKENVARDVGINLLLFSLVFGMAASLNTRSLKKQVINKSAWITGIFLQFVILPLVWFGLIGLLDLNFESGVVLLILMTSPGGAYSNWCCSLINGELGLSIVMTMVSSFVSIIMIPCNIIFYTSFVYEEDTAAVLNWFSLYLSIIVVILATSTGLYCSSVLDSTQFNIFANRMGNISGVTILIFTFLIMYYGEDMNVQVWNKPWQFYFGLILPTFIALSLSTTFASLFALPKPERVAVAIESSCPNGGIAVSLALSMMKTPELNDALAIPLYLALVQFILFTMYFVITWKLGWTKAPEDANILTVIGKPYEIWNDDDVSGNNESNDASRVVIKVNKSQTLDTERTGREVYEDGEAENRWRRFAFWRNRNRNQTTADTPRTERDPNDVYDDDIVDTRGKRLAFWRKSKVMDADHDAPTISPTFILSPEAFGPTIDNYQVRRPPTSTFSPDAFQGTMQTKTVITKNKSSGRLSRAVKSLFIQETIGEDSLAEDPDISIAGDSDLESGLSVSEYGDDVSLSGDSLNRPISREGRRARNVSKQEKSRSKAVKDSSTDKVYPDTKQSSEKTSVGETSNVSAPNNVSSDSERPGLHRDLSAINEGHETSSSSFSSSSVSREGDKNNNNANEEVAGDVMEEIMLNDDEKFQSNAQNNVEKIDDHSIRSKFSV